MKLVNQTDVLDRALGYEGAVRFLKKTGFDGVDLSLFGMYNDDDYWCQPDYREKAEHLKQVGQEIGIEFLQAHAPYPSNKGEKEFDDMAFSRIVRAMEIASIIGIPRIVVHPLEHINYLRNRKQLFEMSVDFYKRLIPFCEQFRIQVCTENMWEFDRNRHVITYGICADPEEFRAMLEKINSPWITGCLDLGHCALVGIAPGDAIRTLGHDHVQALHVHDVDYIHDCHTMPYLESLNWDTITEALGEIDYQGEFDFETHFYFAKLPQELWEPAGVLLEKTGRLLMEKVEKARAARKPGQENINQE